MDTTRLKFWTRVKQAELVGTLGHEVYSVIFTPRRRWFRRGYEVEIIFAEKKGKGE